MIPVQADAVEPRATAAVGSALARGLPILLVVLGIAAYANSLNTPFVFDDHKWIVSSPDIRALPDLSRVMSNTNRPLLKLSLALNYAAGGQSVWGYHAVNLIIHLLAGLSLFGILRRTLEGPLLRARYGGESSGIAFAVAALWLLHPLQTQSVSYIVQRGESLMGLLYFATLYCAIRLAEGKRPLWWASAGVLACAAGMGTKPVMVTAPLMVLLYDRTFLAGSFREALRQRGPFLAGLAASWSILVWVVGDLEEGAGSITSTSLEYALTQVGVVAHYLRLSAWPDPLCLDYYWLPVQSLGGVIAPGLLVAPLAVASLWGLVRAPALGFVGAWFFVILAPTSSFLPIADPAFEHRMYLPLAAPVVAVVLGARWLLQRTSAAPAVGIALFLSAAIALGALTVRRNHDYRSGVALWQTVVELAPHNPRAHYSLANMYRIDKKFPQAISHYRRALELRPDYTDAHSNLGNVLRRDGQLDAAIEAYRATLEINPRYVNALTNLGNALREKGDRHGAINLYRRALEIQPSSVQTHHNMAMALAAGGHASDALAHLAEAVGLRPNNPIPSGNIARLLSRAVGQTLPAPNPGRPETAMESAELFFALSKQYARASKPQLAADAEVVARAFAFTRARPQKPR